MIALVFGQNPLAHRLAYYLHAYAEKRDIPAVVHQTSVGSMVQVQDKMWATVTSASHSGRPTVVINASELSDLEICETTPDRAWKQNTRDAAYIAYAARTADVPLLHISSDHVFRGNSGPYADDKAPTNPLNVYGVTKWYAEQAVQKIHPYRELVDSNVPAGTRIIRTSELYGYDVPSLPAEKTRVEGDEVSTSGLIRDGSRHTPSFIGEVAFLIARNIVHNSGWGQRVIHIAPDIPSITWGNFLHNLGQQVTYQKHEFPERAKVARKGESRGLLPSAGWFLPSDPAKSFREFRDEYRQQAYMKYWNE